jgi:hypothetical protein
MPTTTRARNSRNASGSVQRPTASRDSSETRPIKATTTTSSSSRKGRSPSKAAPGQVRRQLGGAPSHTATAVRDARRRPGTDEKSTERLGDPIQSSRGGRDDQGQQNFGRDERGANSGRGARS